MPLTSTSEPAHYDPNSNNVYFYMNDGSKRIRCGGTELTLEHLDPELNCTMRQHLRVFDKNRAYLERHASDKYDAKELEADGRTVLVRVADISVSTSR